MIETALRLLNVVVWSVMLVYMAPGAWAATRGQVRYGDPMRLACALTAVIFIAFNGYRLLPSDSDALLNGLLVLSAALGAYIMALGRTYGRGPLLKRDDDDAR